MCVYAFVAVIIFRFKSLHEEEKWENIFQDYNLSSEWQSLYRNIYTTTNDTVLRIFQYKLIMRILPTNTLLFKYKYVNSNVCDFCNCHDETIEHIFWECHVSQSLWSNLNNFIQENSINGLIRKKEALLGHVNNNNININLSNTLILMMKILHIHNDTQQKYSNISCLLKILKAQSIH